VNGALPQCVSVARAQPSLALRASPANKLRSEFKCSGPVRDHREEMRTACFHAVNGALPQRVSVARAQPSLALRAASPADETIPVPCALRVVCERERDGPVEQ